MISLHKPLFTYFTVLFKISTFYLPSTEEMVYPHIFINYMLYYIYPNVLKPNHTLIRTLTHRLTHFTYILLLSF